MNFPPIRSTRTRHGVRPGGRSLRDHRHTAVSGGGFGRWVTVIQGVSLVICVLTFRRGVVGEIAYYFKRSLGILGITRETTHG